MKDDQTPATKADIHLLMEAIKQLRDGIERSQDVITRYFDAAVEEICQDFLRLNHDVLQELRDRTNANETLSHRLESHPENN